MTRMRRVTLRGWTAALACATALVAYATVASAQTPAPTSSSSAKPAKPTPAVRTSSSRPLTRPLTLDTQNIEGKAESPRVLFVHMGPNIALEDAPKHPSYLRDDFTAALSSPVRLVVRPYPPLVLTPVAGGNR